MLAKRDVLHFPMQCGVCDRERDDEAAASGRMTINERLLRWTLVAVIARNKSRLWTNERTNERLDERAGERTNDGAVIFWLDEYSDDISVGFAHYCTYPGSVDTNNLFNSPVPESSIASLRAGGTKNR